MKHLILPVAMVAIVGTALYQTVVSPLLASPNLQLVWQFLK